MAYNYKDIEQKWQKKWDEAKLYETDTLSEKKRRYLLVEFPYPSGAGLHVGHVRSYTAMDAIARKSRAEGYEVLFPIGWDAFGLPAENYAIKTGIHPSISTRENIDNFRRQLKACGFSFDWSREVDTTDPHFYRWSQWIFLKLYEKGLAYKKQMPVNWCPKDKCVLANEEVVDGKCERCGTVATKKDKEQWMLAITKYAERLHKDLDETTYLEKIKTQQRNWIGLSEGSEIHFQLVAQTSQTGADLADKYGFDVFTTRADTLFGCTYCVLAPEHALVAELIEKGFIANGKEVTAYRDEAKQKLDIDRSAEGKEKTGVNLEGVMAINPANGEEVPVFIADYVLPQYGTGAIMAVPAHDERDFAFATNFGIPIRKVISPTYTHSSAEKAEMFTKKKKIVSVVEDVSGNILTIKWKPEHGGRLLLGGTVEEGESPEFTALRELKEETGYDDAEVVAVSEENFHYKYFAYSKNQAFDAETKLVHIKLVSMRNIGASLEENEKDKFEIEWVEKANALSGIESPLHIYAYNLFIKNNLYTEEGVLFHSHEFDGLTSAEARRAITEKVGGKIVTKSKLRDWVFARQRYWGEPIPIVYDKEGKMYPVSETEFPIVLPQVDKYEPTDNGESPLAQVPSWVYVKGKINETGHFVSDESGVEFRRETDTMPQWAGSSWYFMRYIDPHNEKAIGDKELLAKWLPVDWYNGGMEHTTLHLLYSRFWYKFLFDIGLVPTSEPYDKRTSQGMILGAGGVKMSKSLGNVVNPDEIVEKYGADVLRVYEMFIGPFDQAVAWDDKAIIGVKRFLDRIEALSEKIQQTDEELTSLTHRTIKAITLGIEEMTFNTCISNLMIWLNEYEKEGIDKANFGVFLKLLSPFAPYLTEELYEKLGESQSVHKAPWPVYDESKLLETVVTISVQVNGKLRGTIIATRDASEASVLEGVKKTDFYARNVGDASIKKVIFVSNKIINIII